MKTAQKVTKKILPILISAGILIYVVYFTKPPPSWNQASSLQVLSVFLPVLVIVTFITNLFINYLPRSFILGFGAILLLVLKIVGILNLLTAPAIILVVIAIFLFFKKPRFTRVTKIPKLKHFNR